MLNSIILLGGLVSAFGLGAISPNQEKQDNTQFRLENHKSVQYDDENYIITLSVDELIYYTWENTWTYLDGAGISLSDVVDGAEFTYDSDLYAIDTEHFLTSAETFYSSDADSYISLVYNNILFNSETNLNVSNYYWVYFTESDEYEQLEFNEPLDLPIDSSYYSAFKQAIELDIQANQPSDNIPQVMSDFIGVLISGISQLAGGLANGIVAMASALFLSTSEGQVTGLSLFGGIIAIFAGLALAVGITTKVYNWVTSLGN